jgi:hypothetical protein
MDLILTVHNIVTKNQDWNLPDLAKVRLIRHTAS